MKCMSCGDETEEFFRCQNCERDLCEICFGNRIEGEMCIDCEEEWENIE